VPIIFPPLFEKILSHTFVKSGHSFAGFYGNNWGLKMIIDRGSYLPPFSVFIKKSDR
jgi:hypothetical protein